MSVTHDGVKARKLVCVCFLAFCMHVCLCSISMLAKGRTLYGIHHRVLGTLPGPLKEYQVLLITEQSLQPLGLAFCRSLFPFYVCVEEQKNLAAGFGGGVFSNNP